MVDLVSIMNRVLVDFLVYIGHYTLLLPSPE